MTNDELERENAQLKRTIRKLLKERNGPDNPDEEVEGRKGEQAASMPGRYAPPTFAET